MSSGDVPLLPYALCSRAQARPLRLAAMVAVRVNDGTVISDDRAQRVSVESSGSGRDGTRSRYEAAAGAQFAAIAQSSAHCRASLASV
jgi:hypothetical protein